MSNLGISNLCVFAIYLLTFSYSFAEFLDHRGSPEASENRKVRFNFIIQGNPLSLMLFIKLQLSLYCKTVPSTKVKLFLVTGRPMLEHPPSAYHAKLGPARCYFRSINFMQCKTSTSINHISKQQDLFNLKD